MKHKNTIKIIALLLSVLFLVPILAECGSGNDPSDSTGTAGTDTSVSDGNRFTPTFDDADSYTEMNKTLRTLIMSQIEGDSLLFSFRLDGAASDSIPHEKNVSFGEENGNETVKAVYRLKDGLEFTLYVTFFADSPSADWVVRVKNTSSVRSGIISELYGTDTKLPLAGKRTLNTTTGTALLGENDVKDFSPLSFDMSDGCSETFSPTAAKSSDRAWPYFDLIGDGCGYIFAIGWTGSWLADFSGTAEGVAIKSGMKKLSAYLEPGEEIRTPSCSLTYFDGSAEKGHNIFRRLILKHYSPTDEKKQVLTLPVSVTTLTYRDDVIISDIEKWQGKLDIDLIWMDAGWYGKFDVDDSGNVIGDLPWGVNLGNWYTINPGLFPSGSMNKLTGYVHSIGKKFILWFEPERAWANSQMINEHRDWYYRLSYNNGSEYILNLGNEKARDWMLDYLTDFLKENGIDYYRQDFNCHELERIFEKEDAEGRVGISEIRHIEGLYYVFDGLRERFPGILIDNCASGGKRMDIEMLKRSVVLHRTDYVCLDYGSHWDMEGVQTQTQDLSYWLPLYGTSVGQPVRLFEDSYLTRSLIAPGVGLGAPVGYAGNNVRARRLISELSDYRAYCTGDYYSLVYAPYDKTSRLAYMFWREDLGEGIVMVYIRPDNTDTDPLHFNLKGLAPDGVYTVTPSEKQALTGRKESYTGKELTENGISVKAEPGSAVILKIKKVG